MQVADTDAADDDDVNDADAMELFSVHILHTYQPLVKSALRLATCDLSQNIKCDLFPGKNSQNTGHPFATKKGRKGPESISENETGLC